LFECLALEGEEQDGFMVLFAEGRAAEGLVCITEVRVAMVQCFARAGATANVLVEFSFVKISSYNKCSLRIYGFQFT
jgi:hypothetical protein